MIQLRSNRDVPCPAPACVAVLLWLFCTAATGANLPWSYRAISNTPPPVVTDARWARADADKFILAKLESQGLSPNPDADRLTLLRRVTFDLTGLPPTEGEILAFTRDPASDDEALARVVDRLLASPRFGERWARHWLDVARYADSVGRSWNAPFLYAFRYRDYVIDALNKDKPFDRFVREQIAGDLLPVTSIEVRRENLTATGFLALGTVNIQLPEGDESRLERVDDQIDATARGFLGLTIGCARCHDHKHEPIRTEDYYTLAGIFMSTETWPGQRYRGGAGVNGYVDQSLLVSLPKAGVAPAAKRAAVSTQRPTASMADTMMAPTATGKNGPLLHEYSPDLAMGVSEGQAEDCAVRVKGELYRLGKTMPRGVPAIAGLPTMKPVRPGASGRLELANWIASPANPLTARVAVNRVWQHLFGRGIVRTVDNFGRSGETPTHPELLDHLASRFIADGWSVKRLVRTLTLSRAYRMSSTGNAASLAKDGANDLFWRMEARRLEAEPLRDAVLFVAGDLRMDRPQGISVAGIGGKGKGAQTRSLVDVESPWRSIYIPVLRAMVPELYETFDFPDPTQIKGQRETTTMASQSLFFLNSDLVARASRNAATRLLQRRDLRDDNARVQALWLQVYGRPAGRDEMAGSLRFMNGLGVARNRDGAVEQWAALVQSLLASGEFRYVL